MCGCISVSFIILMKHVNNVCFSKEKNYKYIDLAVEAYDKYFEILFFRRGSTSGFNYRYSLWYRRGTGRPKLNNCRCEWRDG